MIDHEQQIYTLVSNILKEQFQNLTITDYKLRFYQSTYPALSFVQTNNYVFKESSTFDENESMNIEEYEIEIQSQVDLNEIKKIMYVVDNAMHQLGYVRTYCGLDTKDETTKLKRLIQYQSI